MNAEKTCVRVFAMAALFALALSGCQSERKEDARLADVARFVVPRPAYVKDYYARTEDGWKLALHRYAPEKHDLSRMPVLLCHGLGYNGYFWDLDSSHNVAEYLRRHGWDAWILDLRGGGDSSKPIWYWLRGPDTAVVKHGDVDFTKVTWDIEDYILKDAPAAVDLVRKETGAPAVAWVGHSLGGIIGLCRLERAHQRGQDSGIGCFVGIASPMIVPQPATMFENGFKHFNVAATAINNRWQSLGQALTLGQFRTPMDVFFYNEKNMDHLTLQLLALRVAEDVPSAVLKQLLKMAETGSLISPSDAFNYSGELSRISAPALFLAGRVDHSADAEAVRYGYERISSQDKTFRIFGLAWGDSIDYGHDDLILGRHAPKDVYPAILSWLDTRARLPEKAAASR